MRPGPFTTCSILLLLWAVACAPPRNGGSTTPSTEPPAPAGTSVTGTRELRLSVGETVEIPELGARIRFVEVISDSRCPFEVTCIWAGAVAARFAVSVAKRDPLTIDLSLHPTEPEVATRLVGKLEITLVRVDPHPQKDLEIPPGAYIATIQGKGAEADGAPSSGSAPAHRVP